MALKATLEMPVGNASIKVSVELSEDVSDSADVSQSNRALMAQVIGKVTGAIVESNFCHQGTKQEPAQSEAERTKSADEIVIKTLDWNGGGHHYKVKQTTYIESILECESMRLQVPLDQLRFYGGSDLYCLNIKRTTLEGWSLEDGDTILVHMAIPS